MRPTPTPIRLLVPDAPPADAVYPYLRRIDEHRWYTNFGPLWSEFGVRVSDTLREAGLGSAEVTGVCSATLGLQLALLSMTRAAAPRVLIPSLTFSGTAQAVASVGGVPVLADIDPDSWVLTPEIARQACEHHAIDLVMPVATYGCPSPQAAWRTFREDTGIPVLIDAAGAFGNQAVGDVPVVFSFHATKALTCGEGGGLCTVDPELTEQVRRRSNFGINLRDGSVGLLGTNGKMSEYNAAVGLASLDRWPAARARRQAMHTLHREAARNLAGPPRLQQRPADGTYTIFPLLFRDAAQRARCERELRTIGSEFRRWYCPPIHDTPWFRSTPRASDLPNTEHVVDRLLCVPFHPSLEDAERQTVFEALQRACSEGTA